MIVRRMIIIIVAVTLLAVGFQFLRSLGVVNLIKNVNSDVELGLSVSPDIPQGVDFEKYLMIWNPDEENSKLTADNTLKVMEYIKKDYDLVGINDKTGDLSTYDAIFFAFERLDYLPDLDRYIDFVKNGGHLVFLIRPLPDKSFENIAPILGISDYSTKTTGIRGINVVSGFMIGAEGFSSDSSIILNSSLEVSIDNTCTVFLESFEGNPMVWDKEYGEGRVVVFNGTILNDKANRGLLVSVLALSKDVFIYPIMNIKMVHIDDFPSPIPNGTDPKISEEFGRDISQFYREVWWSDMIRLSKKYDIKYTGFVIETYSDITTPPFRKANSEELKNLIFYGRELLGIDGEMGLHGYNHQSLAPEGYIVQDLGYNPWASTEDMRSSIQELVRNIHTIFGKYELRAYVPPSNILSPEGRTAVVTADTDIKIISSVFTENIEGDIYEQEFEVAEDGIIEFPRLSAGYSKNEESLWNIYNGLNMYGIFSHFIHPDDVLDPERNKGKSWTLLLDEFDEMLGETVGKLGWLRGFTISSAAVELVKYLECNTLVDTSKENFVRIYTQDYRNNIYCIMKTDKKITKVRNCEYLSISENTYLLTLKSEISEITFK